MLSAVPEMFDACEEILAKEYGPISLSSDVFDFMYTDYYNEEMGEGIKRKFLAFERLIQPDEIAAIKIRTNEIERDIAAKGDSHHLRAGRPYRASALRNGNSHLSVPRPVNLDPGYIDAGKLVLATVKDQAHRIYLSGGIYAEVTLYWKHGAWETWPWTYADYRSEGYQRFLAEVREYHLKILKVAE
jgi:hypothetical protein